MTVPSSTSRDQQTGNGVTVAFTVPFRILDQSHLRVLLTIAGVTTEQTLTTHYSISGVGDSSTTVTFVAAPASGAKVTFLRNVPFTQDTDYVPNDPFPAESHERALDKLTMQVQQLNELAGENGRVIKIPAEVSGVSTTMPTPVANTLWGWDAEADAPRLFSLSEVATTAIGANWRYEKFAGTGAQTAFTLADDPGGIANMDVSIDGVTQVPGDDYTLLGAEMDFAVAPANGAVILVRYGTALAQPIGGTWQSIEVAVEVGDTVVAIPGIASGSIEQVYYNGVFQNPSSYTVAGASIHLTEALPAAGKVTAVVADGAFSGSIGSGNLSQTLALTGAVTRTVRDKLGDIVSAKDFGAVGDGVTNDTAAIQAGIDALEAAGGGTLYFPRGTYHKTTVWIDADNIHIRGDGVGATKFTSPDGSPCFGIGIEQGGFVTPVAIENISLRGFEVDGNKAGASGAGGNVGIAIYQASRIVLEDLYVHDCDGYGIGFLGTDQPNRQNATVRDVEISGAAYDGLDIKAGYDQILLENVYSHDNGGGSDAARDKVGIDIRGTNVTVRKCRAVNCETEGIRVRSNAGSPIFLYDCVADNTTNNDGFCFSAPDGSDVFVSNCYSVNSRYGFRVDAGNVHLTNCVARGNTDGLRVDVGSNTESSVTVTGGEFSDNTSDGIRNNAVNMTKPMRVTGALVMANGRYGVRTEGPLHLNNSVVANNNTGGAGGPGVLITASCAYYQINACKITDLRSAGKTQTIGVQWAAGHGAGVMMGNDLTGNSAATTSGTPASGSLFYQATGTSPVRFGTLTASADAAVSGYITITDAAGNSRKLAVIT